jgi:nucleotide-binding universal stress UspA family protein
MRRSVAEVIAMLAVRRILHPTDFSKHSDVALRLAASLARTYGAELVRAHVAEPPMPIATEGLMIVPTMLDLEAIRKQLDDVPVEDGSLAVRRVVLEGDPATELLELADEVECDLIVLGTHGRTGLTRMLMGSVAEELVRRAKCPVLTVKNPPREEVAVAPKETAAAAR